MTPSPYTLLVNSCDGFSDCWHPFFKLLTDFGPQGGFPILLNTEEKDYAFPGLLLTASRVGGPPRVPRLTWSEALLAALDQVTTPLILYVQEDYFLASAVDSVLVDEFAALMLREDIALIELTTFGSDGPFHASRCPLLQELDRRARYRIALQAGLWRVDRLRSYLRAHENAWQFEKLGTLRAWRAKDRFLALDRGVFGVGRRADVFPYVKTGIIKGQWFKPAVVPLFDQHGIEVDFSKRGFYTPKSKVIERLRTLKSVAAHPIGLFKSLR